MSEGDRPRSGLSQASSTATITSVSMGTKPHTTRPIPKVHTFGKRADSIKRDPNMPVIMRGWLYKKDSSGLKLWKRRWFVLSNYCLFYYRDSREEMVLGSIPLPSYEIRTAFSKEKKNRRFVFKAEHPGMRTYYFSAETQLDMNSWIWAMKQSAAAECDYGNYNRSLHNQSVSAHTSYEDCTLTQNDFAKSAESLEIARISETQDAEASSLENIQVGQKESPCPGRASLSASFNGGYLQERIEQPDLSSLSSQTDGCASPLIHTKFSIRPRSPPPHPSENPSPTSSFRTLQPSPLLSIRSSRSYSLPLTPVESPLIPDARSSPPRARRKPPRSAAAQAASCDDLSAMTAHRALARPNTPMGRVDIAPSEGLPHNPYAVLSPSTRGHALTPADRYDVFPSSEDPYCRRYTRSPHPSRARPVGEEGLTPSLGRQQQSRFADRGYISPSSGTSRTLVMSRLHGRLISPHSASSSYLHLPPLPPLPNRSNPGKRTMCRTLVRERSIHNASGQQFENDTDALLTKLCGQDKVLRGLEEEIGHLWTEKERLEKALEVMRLRLEEFKGQDATMEKICCQQRQLQDELVQVRARLCDLALDSDRAWEDYSGLESELQLLKGSLEHIRNVGHPQDQASAQQDLWRIHDILAGLRASPANYLTLESRRTGASPATTPVLDSHLGMSHNALLPCPGEEKESETAPPPGSSLFYHEAISSHGLVTQEPGRTVGQAESKQQDNPSGGEQPNPSSSSRGQQGALWHSSSERVKIEKRSPARETDALGSDHGSHTNILCEDGGHSRAKAVSSDTTAPRRSRMSAQEQLDRMQRNQEAQRKSEASQLNPSGHWRDSLKRGSSRPLPNNPPESSPKEGVQTGGNKPRCPPTPEWERQRVIQLSYALAAEASQRGKRITGRTNSRSSLDNFPGSHDSLDHHHLPSDNNSELEANSVASKHNQTTTQNLSYGGDSKAANHTVPSSQASNHMSCASEVSNWSLPLPEESNRVSSQPRVPKSVLHHPESTNEELSLKSPPLMAPLPQSANRNLSVSRTTSWDPSPFWDYEVWASEQSLVQNQGPSNGRCPRWRGENKSHQVVAYLHETAQPIKVTLVKSSF
ncbi:pleckstrin homology domain-containing family A member 4 [Eublepharis macularius]|uniref:Pleckstrin homology domain-containing family A member 4 n=1 Tax=Eublepharis macularius TaxID=481883 RepID=A0AA97K659_EUBMA|nr:pleckstrin homology domain-containing family A member 4 [Eublepharis macularius]